VVSSESSFARWNSLKSAAAPSFRNEPHGKRRRDVTAFVSDCGTVWPYAVNVSVCPYRDSGLVQTRLMSTFTPGRVHPGGFKTDLSWRANTLVDNRLNLALRYIKDIL
jgi:hypothetical protein